MVASVTFHNPGDAQGVVLRGNFRVTAFDTRRQQLELVYDGGGGGGRVAPFTLRVQGNRATLELAGTRIESSFDWPM